MLAEPQTVLEHFFLFGAIPPNAENGVYIPYLVVLSYIIAFLGSFTGLRLATAIHRAETKQLKLGLHLGGAFAFGAGIWAMHFIGMLAFDMEMALSYDPLLTVTSMIIAVIIAYSVLAIVKSGKLDTLRLIVSAALLGTAICAMHYTGMEAMEIDGDLRYTPGLFCLSFVIAVTASGAALWIVFTLGQHEGQKNLGWQIIAALVMGAAICGMHYTGMAAAVFIPWADCRYDPGQSFESLALAITGISSIIFGLALAIAFYSKEKATGKRSAENMFPARLLKVTLLLTAIAALWMGGNSFYNYYVMTHDLQSNMEAGKLANMMIFMENIQSRYVYKAIRTGEPQWEQAYLKNVPEQDRLHQKFHGYEDPDEEDVSEGFVGKMRKADENIEQLDEEIFDLVRQNRREEAYNILQSAEYVQFKDLDMAAMEEFATEIYDAETEKLISLARNIYYSLYPLMAATAALGVIWFFVLRRLRYWREELVSTQSSLNREKTYLSTIMDNMPLAIFAKDASNGYKWITINKAAEEMFCLKSKNVIGHVDHDFFPKEEADFFRATDEKVMAEGCLVEIDAEPVTTPKGTFTAHTLKVPIYDEDGNPLILLGILEDITEKFTMQEDLRIAKEQAELANAAKSDFLANMSHELRTPLNSIIGMTRMLVEDSTMTIDNRSMAGTVYKSATNLLEIVNDILDISKIEAGNMVLENIGFDMKDMVSNVMETMAPIASAKGITLKYHYEHEDMPYLIGDPLRVGRILTNLVSNAIKYTEKGEVGIIFDKKHLPSERMETETFALNKDGVYINIDTKTLNKGRIELHCAVTDTGIGIPEDKLTIIFEKFTQADETVSRKYGGTGLGLAITKDLVEMMGGTIGVQSEVGKGSTFWFKIPFDITGKLDEKAQSRKKRRRQDNKNAGNKIDSAKARILVAEDHLLNQDFIQRLLKRQGFQELDLVENGVAALKAYEEKSYDLILMDCHMPDKNGYEATQNIREKEKETGKHVPIIALTADAMQGTQEKCLDAGMDEYLSKPIDADELKDVLEQWISFPEAKIKETTGKENNANAPVDMTLLAGYAETPEDIAQFIKVFLKQSEESVNILREYCIEGECREWVEAAHKFKGGAGMVGAKKLQGLCEQAQAMAGSSAADRQKMFKNIETEYKIVKNYLSDSKI